MWRGRYGGRLALSTAGATIGRSAVLLGGGPMLAGLTAIEVGGEWRWLRADRAARSGAADRADGAGADPSRSPAAKLREADPHDARTPLVIAQEAGFRSEGRCNRLFRESFGVLPREFRGRMAANGGMAVLREEVRYPPVLGPRFCVVERNPPPLGGGGML